MEESEPTLDPETTECLDFVVVIRSTKKMLMSIPKEDQDRISWSWGEEAVDEVAEVDGSDLSKVEDSTTRTGNDSKLRHVQ